MGSIDFNFKRYLALFEECIICQGVKRELLGKILSVNIREGKFSCSRFARIVGRVSPFSIPFVIDYYGHLKRSQGFVDVAREVVNSMRDQQIKSIDTTVVFFASLKIEEIADITGDQYLKGGFSELKKTLLQWRNFEKGENQHKLYDAFT